MLFRPEGFPWFHDAIKWTYGYKMNWYDEYKYLILKGLEPITRPTNVSVTVLFSPEVFFNAGLSNRFLVMMIAGYAIEVNI